jgi:hypothetical protein
MSHSTATMEICYDNILRDKSGRVEEDDSFSDDDRLLEEIGSTGNNFRVYMKCYFKTESRHETDNKTIIKKEKGLKFHRTFRAGTSS